MKIDKAERKAVRKNVTLLEGVPISERHEILITTTKTRCDYLKEIVNKHDT
jgi:hypothetical protein